MAIRLKSQQCLARQVCAASPDTCSTAGCSPAVCGQAVACLPGAAAVPLGRSGETSWLGSNERTGARACLVLSALGPAPSGAEQEGQDRGATAMGDAPYSPASWVPPAQSQCGFSVPLLLLPFTQHMRTTGEATQHLCWDGAFVRWAW